MTTENLPGTREIDIDTLDDMSYERTETLMVNEYSIADLVVRATEDVDAGLEDLVRLGHVKKARRVAIAVRDRIYVLAYEAMTYDELIQRDLLASAKAKLTDDEYDAVRRAK